MKHKTEEFLHFLMWTCDRLLQPTFRNLTDSFEQWCARTGSDRHINRLIQRQWIETKSQGDSERLMKLTDEGRRMIYGGRDPLENWDRDWDGQWRMIMFDLHLNQNTERQRLRRYLHLRGFGCLQKSVWVTPHPLADEAELLAETKVNAKSMIFLNATPAAGESDEEIVSTTWDFNQINSRWQSYLEMLDTKPNVSLESEKKANALYEWTNAERRAWRHAISADPLLPRLIWPDGYLGEQALKKRNQTMAADTGA